MIQASGYIASPSIQTSTANQELIPSAPSHWSSGYQIRKLSFENTQQACTIVINGETTLYLEAGDGFEMGYEDPTITSFVIKEANITYKFIACF